jgi:hypothetical protein
MQILLFQLAESILILLIQPFAMIIGAYLGIYLVPGKIIGNYWDEKYAL